MCLDEIVIIWDECMTFCRFESLQISHAAPRPSTCPTTSFRREGGTATPIKFRVRVDFPFRGLRGAGGISASTEISKPAFRHTPFAINSAFNDDHLIQNLQYLVMNQPVRCDDFTASDKVTTTGKICDHATSFPDDDHPCGDIPGS